MLGIAVIFVYYVMMFTAQAMTKGGLIPAWLSMWVPNIVLGIAGVALVVSRSRGVDRAMLFRLPRLPFRRGADTPASDAAASASSPPAAPVDRCS